MLLQIAFFLMGFLMVRPFLGLVFRRGCRSVLCFWRWLQASAIKLERDVALLRVAEVLLRVGVVEQERNGALVRVGEVGQERDRALLQVGEVKQERDRALLQVAELERQLRVAQGQAGLFSREGMKFFQAFRFLLGEANTLVQLYNSLADHFEFFRNRSTFQTILAGEIIRVVRPDDHQWNQLDEGHQMAIIVGFRENFMPDQNFRDQVQRFPLFNDLPSGEVAVDQQPEAEGGEEDQKSDASSEL